jgi:hypothetical protein
MQPKSHINAANFSSAAFSLDEDTDSPLIDYNQGNYLFRVENAHQDDVHAVVKAGTSILTGSKDCSVKIWSPDLKLLETKDERQNVNYSVKIWSPDLKLLETKDERQNVNYKEWVTALFHLGNGEWVYGNRSGQLFKYNCEHQLENQAKIWVSKHVSKARNLNRISCLSAIYSTNNTVSKLLVGVAKSIQVWHVNENLKFIYKVDVSENDWVYCIEPLQNNKFFVVIGCNLEVWENVQMQGQKKWSLECIAKVHNEIIKERFFNEDKRQRPFISAIECINNETLGMVDFSSRVKWIDLERGELLYNKKLLFTLSASPGFK